ncbi:MAG TPA: hypothetical protein VGC41_25220 [Kofleriaceae bacterium]
MNVLLVGLLVLSACERQVAPPDRDPPPRKPDPIAQARAEFETIAPEYGSSKIYSRADFIDDAERAGDEGDFVGRLRTLFGAQPGDRYVLRHKATGFVITASFGGAGPSFGGGMKIDNPPGIEANLARLRANDEAAQLRIAADPVLANNPLLHASPNATDAERDLAMKQYAIYQRHLHDALAPAGFPPIAAELDRLIEAVPPADWSKIDYYDEADVVARIGVAHGRSFSEVLAPEPALTFLLDQGDTRPADDRDEVGNGPWDLATMYYWEEHEVPVLRPRVEAALQRLALHARADHDAFMLEQANRFASQMHVRLH